MNVVEITQPKKITITGHVSVPMTAAQKVTTKKFIIANQLGLNVQPNEHDIARPYRIALKLDNDTPWANFGQYKSADVAAAISSVVSLAYFGEKAKAGKFDAAKVEASKEYTDFITDVRNEDIIARAEGTKPTFIAEKNAAVTA